MLTRQHFFIFNRSTPLPPLTTHFEICLWKVVMYTTSWCRVVRRSSKKDLKNIFEPYHAVWGVSGISFLVCDFSRFQRRCFTIGLLSSMYRSSYVLLLKKYHSDRWNFIGWKNLILKENNFPKCLVWVVMIIINLVGKTVFSMLFHHHLNFWFKHYGKIPDQKL